MSVLTLYAGSTSSFTASNKLPSPTGVKATLEQIWSENTGRAQSGDNKAKMVGDSITTKHTYTIEWAMLTDRADLTKITDLLPRGFFYFGIGTPTTPPSDPSKYYRSEIQYEVIMAGADRCYKNVNVTVIEQ